jgi:pimeloyl-ACP methyl ester carboxylesterase
MQSTHTSHHLCETFQMHSQWYLNQRGFQVMRMQQIMTASMVAVVAIWGVYFWHFSPWVSFFGSLICIFGYSIILAAEFVALLLVNRSDPAPRPSCKEVLNAWLSETCLVPTLFCWRQPFRPYEVPDQLCGQNLLGQRGVIFIHGLICNRGFWTHWLKQLKRHGLNERAHAFIALSLEPVFVGIDDYAEQIEKGVQAVTAASGLPSILVCHSMGGLAARAWLSRQTDNCRVHHVVTIASLHNGTWLARFAYGQSGRQMRQSSEWLRQLVRQAESDGLETEKEKASAHREKLFTCWYSNCDNIVFPSSTAMLPGADNRLVRGAAHLQLAFMPEVIMTTLEMIVRPPKASEKHR